MTRKERQRNPHLAAEAAEWFTTMQSADAGARERTQFSEWLALSSEHVQEYLAIAALWRDLAVTHDARRSAEDLLAAARSEAESSNIVDLRGDPSEVRDAVVTPRPALVSRRGAIAAGVALLVFGAVAGFFAERQLSGQRYATGIGEQSSHTLADGSTIKLNTQSVVRVRMSEHSREILLLAGEAMFEVAKDSARPFRVHVDDASIEALGTVFNVYRAPEEMRVTVLEGRVRVQDDNAAGIELEAKERARVSHQGAVVKEIANVEQTQAWTRRRLVFYTQTLQTVVDEFNRYNVQRLAVTDPELAGLRISGNFSAADPQSLVQFLERTESVSAVANADGVVQLSRK